MAHKTRNPKPETRNSSFTALVKQELNRVRSERPCCRTAQLAALFRGAGSFHINGRERYGVDITLGLSATARNSVSMIRAFGLPVEIRVREEKRLGRHKRFEIYLEGGSRFVQFLNEIGIFSDHMSLRRATPRRIIRRQCCRAAFLRGAFLAGGSVNGPGSPAHLEICAGGPAFLTTVRKAAAGFDISLSMAVRRQRSFLYSKNLKAVRDFLVRTGAHETALKFEQQAIMAAVREGANRRANCDQANAARCSRAAARQVRAIEALRRTGAWDHLRPGLVEIAELRLRHPSSTIVELGQKAAPPLTKSAVNHRLRRIMQIVSESSLRGPDFGF